MGILFQLLTSIVLVSYIILAPATATATVPVASTILVGQNSSVYLSLAYEDAGEGMAVVKSRLQQDIHALEHVFQSLQETGELSGRYPLLLIRAGSRLNSKSSFTPPTATLFLTPTVALINAFPISGPLDGIYRTQNLGPAYVIDVAAGPLNFADLLALVSLLPRLNEQNPLLTVSDEKILAQIKSSREYQAFSNSRLELRPFVSWGTSERQILAPIWQAGVFSYSAVDFLGNRLFELQPLAYYLTRPSWSPPIPRFLAYATEKELYIFETFSRKTHRIELTALFPLRYLQMSESIELAVSPQGDYLYFTLAPNLPEEFWKTESHTYVFVTATGETRVAEAKAPKVAEPARGSSKGIPVPFETPLPGYVSSIYQLSNSGWPLQRLSRYDSFISPQWAALLPKDRLPVFLPAELLGQSRFLAYGSQAEIVVFNIIEQRYHRLNLKELLSADYQEITGIRFAQNQMGDKIYFSLEIYGDLALAYIWDIFTDTLEQSDKTLEEIQPEGWAEFDPGAENYLLPPGSKVLAGNEARRAIIRYMFSLPIVAYVSILAWLGVLFFAFSLPFVLAHAATFLVALKLKSARLLLGPGPALTTMLFVALSILAIRFTLPYGEVIERLVYPLPWLYDLSSTAGMIIFGGFVLAVLAVLTILVFYHARILPRTFFQDSTRFQQEGKSVAVSASAIYGLAGALLLYLLSGLAATTLPYYQLPRGLDVQLFPAILFVLCLAVTLFLIKAPKAAAGYLTAAAAFLGAGYVVFSNIGFIRVISDYSHLAEAMWRLVAEGALFSRFVEILPVTLTCIVYLVRMELMRRSRLLKTTAELAATVLIAALATAILIFGERLHWLVLGLGYFQLPVTFALVALTAVVIIAALVHVFRPTAKQPVPPTTSPAAAAPAAKKLKLSVGLAAAGVSALLVFALLTLGAGAFIPQYSGLLLLLATFYLAVASVFYLARLLTVRLAALLYTPERISELTSKL